MPHIQHNRRGISLLEVLISIGILSVGLASVLAVLPAGGSQAKKAMIEDRRSALAASALADCVNRGFLNPVKWAGATLPPIVIDPFGVNTTVVSGSARFPVGLVPVSVTTTIDDVFIGGDDLSIQTPEEETATPTQRVTTSGKRLSEGRFTWLATLVPMTAGSVTTTSFFRLSVVEFYQRPIDSERGNSARVFPATFLGPSSTILNPSVNRDDFKKFFAKGSAVLATNGTAFRWLRILMASPTENAAGTITAVDLELDQDVTASTNPLPFTPNQIYTYAGSVGVAEQIVRLEEDTPWTAP
jgi:hypothetical protein